MYRLITVNVTLVSFLGALSVSCSHNQALSEVGSANGTESATIAPLDEATLASSEPSPDVSVAPVTDPEPREEIAKPPAPHKRHKAHKLAKGHKKHKMKSRVVAHGRHKKPKLKAKSVERTQVAALSTGAADIPPPPSAPPSASIENTLDSAPQAVSPPPAQISESMPIPTENSFSYAQYAILVIGAALLGWIGLRWYQKRRRTELYRAIEVTGSR